MNSIAERGFIVELGKALASDIPLRAKKSDSYRVWTEAVYASLGEISKQYGWKIFPEIKCYAGEYLCDFTLHEDGYGCRIACESQWEHWKGNHQSDLDWAFDKLRGVKSDIKLFIFEGTEEQWRKVIQDYLQDYEQLSTREAYVALRYQVDRFVTSWWTPKHDGKQTEPIQFEIFAGFDAPDESILDVYGNNAAVRCPACTQVFVVSSMVNKVNGRVCPHCKGSVASIDGNTYKVKAIDGPQVVSTISTSDQSQ